MNVTLNIDLIASALQHRINIGIVSSRNNVAATVTTTRHQRSTRSNARHRADNSFSARNAYRGNIAPSYHNRNSSTLHNALISASDINAVTNIGVAAGS